ncbi:hypothetical protein K1719_044082 [Acacia pycnantha]|nr:hypothetical protein K1719_044082 [Acacia pycnantha]
MFADGLKTYRQLINAKEQGGPKWFKPTCHQQPGSTECGYYVMSWMQSIVNNGRIQGFQNDMYMLLKRLVCLFTSSSQCLGRVPTHEFPHPLARVPRSAGYWGSVVRKEWMVTTIAHLQSGKHLRILMGIIYKVDVAQLIFLKCKFEDEIAKTFVICDYLIMLFRSNRSLHVRKRT